MSEFSFERETIASPARQLKAVFDEKLGYDEIRQRNKVTKKFLAYSWMDGVGEEESERRYPYTSLTREVGADHASYSIKDFVLEEAAGRLPCFDKTRMGQVGSTRTFRFKGDGAEELCTYSTFKGEKSGWKVMPDEEVEFILGSIQKVWNIERPSVAGNTVVSALLYGVKAIEHCLKRVRTTEDSE